jgi:phosphohistidine phosphatase
MIDRVNCNNSYSDNKMDLILWRHAEAEPGYPDAERPLTDKGRRQAQKMAQYLLPLLPKQARILVSPARRAQQTAETLGRAFVIEPLISPESSLDDVLRALSGPQTRGGVMLVGHQPTLGQLASHYLTQSDAGMALSKGAVVWIAGRPGAGGWQAKLHWAMTVRALP